MHTPVTGKCQWKFQWWVRSAGLMRMSTLHILYICIANFCIASFIHVWSFMCIQLCIYIYIYIWAIYGTYPDHSRPMYYNLDTTNGNIVFWHRIVVSGPWKTDLKPPGSRILYRPSQLPSPWYFPDETGAFPLLQRLDLCQTFQVKLYNWFPHFFQSSWFNEMFSHFWKVFSCPLVHLTR